MLLPRYSTRVLLGVVTAAALFWLLVARSIRGDQWAVVVVVAIATLLLGLVLHALLFVAVWSLSLVFQRTPKPPSAAPPLTMET